MKKTSRILLALSTLFLIVIFYYSERLFGEYETGPSSVIPKKEPANYFEHKDDVLLNRKVLDVLYVSEAPEGVWKQPWANACEEASVAMVDLYYQGKKTFGIQEAKKYLQNLFEKEDVLFGTSANASGEQIMKLIKSNNLFSAILKINPTIEDIKKEIIAGRPVISLHRGFDLQNKDIGFAPTKSSYHTLVVVGFDDSTKMFVTHDPGDEIEGEYYTYSYSIFMDSLHDYDMLRDKADGVPTVIFTDK